MVGSNVDATVNGTFQADVAEFKLWNRVLSDADFLSAFRTMKTRFTVP